MGAGNTEPGPAASPKRRRAAHTRGGQVCTMPGSIFTVGSRIDRRLTRLRQNAADGIVPIVTGCSRPATDLGCEIDAAAGAYDRGREIVDRISVATRRQDILERFAYGSLVSLDPSA
jgi:hypothetical protein